MVINKIRMKTELTRRMISCGYPMWRMTDCPATKLEDEVSILTRCSILLYKFTYASMYVCMYSCLRSASFDYVCGYVCNVPAYLCGLACGARTYACNVIVYVRMSGCRFVRRGYCKYAYEECM